MKILFWRIDIKITEKNIFDEARKSNLEALRSDFVDKVKDNYGWTPLHELAYRGVKETLSHPSVDTIKDNDDWTPLHFLAWNGIKDVLSHPSVDKVKDRYNRTPLHRLAMKGVKEVLSHPSVDTLKNNKDETPLHDLAHGNYLTKEDLRKKYPWYKKEIKDIKEAITEIVNTPAFVIFILDD